MTTPTERPALPKVGPIGYASVSDVQLYATHLAIGPRLPGVRDVALWTTDQMHAYYDAGTAPLRAENEAQARRIKELEAELSETEALRASAIQANIECHRDWKQAADARDAALIRVAEMDDTLKRIGDYAHDKSTGPAVPDALWEIRAMAYEEFARPSPGAASNGGPALPPTQGGAG